MALGFTTGGGIEAAEQDDLSDVSVITKAVDSGGITVVNYSGGSGTWLGGEILVSGSSGTHTVDITVDGTTTSFAVSDFADNAVQDESHLPIPPIKFESSIKIVLNDSDGAMGLGSLKT